MSDMSDYSPEEQVVGEAFGGGPWPDEAAGEHEPEGGPGDPESEAWRPSQEEWEQTMELVQGLAPLAEMVQQLEADPDAFLDEDDEEGLYDGSYSDYLNGVMRREIGKEIAPLRDYMEWRAEQDERKQAAEEAQQQEQQRAVDEVMYAQAQQEAHELINAELKRVGYRNGDPNAILGNILGKLAAFQTAARSAGYREDEIQQVTNSPRVAAMLTAEAVEEALNRAKIDRALEKV